MDPKVHKDLTSILANERTYAAWIRTGLTALATALGSGAFLPGIIPEFSIHIITTILTLCCILCFYLAAWRYRHVGLRLAEINVFGAPTYLLILISCLLIIVGLIALIGFWTYN